MERMKIVYRAGSRWVWLPIMLSFFFLGILCGKGGTYPQKQASTNSAPPGMASVWTETPILPWNGSSSVASRWSKMLEGKLDLTRRGRSGEQHRYLIRRQNLSVDRYGRILTR